MIFIFVPRGKIWRRRFSCGDTGNLPWGWMESSGTDNGADINLFEFAPEIHSSESSAFIAGLLYERSAGFSGNYHGSVAVIISEIDVAANAEPGPVIHHRIDIAERRYYPDIILGHGFREGLFTPEPGEMHGSLYRAFDGLLSPHQLVSVAMPAASQRDDPQTHRGINALIDYIRRIEALGRDEREAAVYAEREVQRQSKREESPVSFNSRRRMIKTVRGDILSQRSDQNRERDI